MTAQVAVMNLKGIAVASDTVVTLMSDGNAKTIGNTEKIYSIGGKHKVLILHSASVDITGIPHQLHIAEWAKTLGEPKPTLQAYVDSYRAWVATESRMVASGSEVRLLHRMLNDHYYYLKGRIESELEALVFEESLTEKKKDSARQATILRIVEEGLDYLQKLENYATLTDKSASKLMTTLEIDIDEKIQYIFKNVKISEKALHALHESAPLVLSRSQAMGDIDSDLGFVGFGEEEPYAKVIRLKCRGIYGGTLQALIAGSNVVSPERDSGSLISYFAQYDAMWGFVNGARPEFMHEFKRRVANKVEENWGSSTPEPIGWQLANDVEQEMDEWAQSRYIDPLLNTIDGMGLKGLAELADSLVSLQALAANGDRGPATVGGLIEVATIDRINGVQWVRRLG